MSTSAAPGRMGVEVARRIAVATLRGWLVELGVPARWVFPVLAATFVGSASLALLGAAALATSDLIEPFDSPRVSVLVLVALVWVTAFTAIFAAAAGAPVTGAIRFLRSLPLTDRELGAALAAPTLAAAALQACLLAPSTGLIVARGLDCHYLMGVWLALLANILGTLQGRVLFGAARRRAMRRHRVLPPQLVAIVGLAACIVAGQFTLAAIRYAGTHGGLSPSPLVAAITIPLGWPGLVAYAVRADWTGTALLLAALAFVGAAEVRGWPWLTAATELRPRSTPARWVVRMDRRLPLAGLQAVRMVRNERVRNVIGALVVLEALTLALVLLSPHEMRVGFVDNAILLWCITAAGLPVLARGLSARHRPFVLTAGFDPFRWGSAVFSGSTLLALGLLVPALTAVALVEADPALFLGGLGQGLFVCAVAALLGGIATPRVGTGPAETLALGLVLGADLIVGNWIDRLTPVSSPAQIGMVMGLLSVPMLVLPGLVERWRWRQDVGVAT